MVLAANGNSYVVDGLNEGDQLQYSFTYWDTSLNGARDSEVFNEIFSLNTPDDPEPVTGAQQAGGDVLFTVTNQAWADVHYQVNGGIQQNHRMIQSGGYNRFVLSGLHPGDSVTYNFTYWDTTLGYAVVTGQTVLVFQ